MILTRYNQRPFKSEAVKVRHCLPWSSQMVIPYVPSCWVVFPVTSSRRWSMLQDEWHPQLCYGTPSRLLPWKCWSFPFTSCCLLLNAHIHTRQQT